MKKLSSIFNDVIGPVMRGPSSSHTAASWRIARTSLEILNDQLKHALVEFDRDGAWAPNFREQGTCMGIEGGLLALDITDELMKQTEDLLSRQGIEVIYQVSSFPTNHANTVRLSLTGQSGKKIQIIAVSLGGGSFEIRNINGFDMSLNGEWFMLLLFTKGSSDVSSKIARHFPPDIEILSQRKESEISYVCRSSSDFDPELVRTLEEYPEVIKAAVVNPIMPVIAGKQRELPFSSVSSLLAYAEKSKLDLGDLGIMYEQHISGLTSMELGSKMQDLIRIIHGSIDTGLKGTYYRDRILQQQSHLIEHAERDGKIKRNIVNRIIANVSALMESKSSMELVVAVPTAGSCGTVGGGVAGCIRRSGIRPGQIGKSLFYRRDCGRILCTGAWIFGGRARLPGGVWGLCRDGSSSYCTAFGRNSTTSNRSSIYGHSKYDWFSM